MRFSMFIFLSFFPFLMATAQKGVYWKTLIETGDSCRYFVPKEDIGRSWISGQFNDSTWAKGKSGIGFGDNDDNTTIKGDIPTVYLRYSFMVEDTSSFFSLILDADYDDGFVAYLNGVEIARANIIDPVRWKMVLSADHEATMYKKGRPDRFVVNKNLFQKLLVNGENLLAVEVHNSQLYSDDLTSNFFLHAGLISETDNYRDVPAWFWKPEIYSDFNLPLIVINTNGNKILNDPRIIAEMKLINNGYEKPNTIFDLPNEYSGKVSIETRGESSQQWDKKSYSIELIKEDSTNNNSSLLGLPKENDFVLYAPYSDRTLLKNVLTNQLYRELGGWAPRTRFVEVIINDDYRGVYVLMEKIKQDKNRVNIKKLTADDVSDTDISGGYILRRDKTTEIDFQEFWQSPVKQIYYEPLTYQYFDPNYRNLTDKQRQYIKDWMKGFDEIMSSSSFADPQNGYSKLIDQKSFIDMLFINELSKGIDCYMFSSYFYKDNDKDGGKLNAGPPWDNDLNFGNLNYGQNDNVPYTYSTLYNHWGRIYWWNRLMEAPRFKNEVYRLWDQSTPGVFNASHIESIIDSCINYLGPAIERNFNRYPILGIYVWPNSYNPPTYQQEIDFTKTWINDRLIWLNKEWGNKYNPNIPTSDEAIGLNKGNSVTVFPNPSDFSNLQFMVNLPEKESVLKMELYNIYGRVIESIELKPNEEGKAVYSFSNHSDLPNGLYTYKLYNHTAPVCSGKVLKISN